MARTALQQRSHDATQRAILDAALELFIEHSYEQVSIRNIAAKVGYSPAAIYSYFGSKDDIFFALAEEGLRIINATDPIAAPSGDALDDIRATARHLYDFSNQHPEFFALIFVDRHVPKISAEYARFRFLNDIWRRLEARVQRCIDEGVFPATLSPFVALRLLIAPILGIAAQRISSRLAPNEDGDALAADAIEVTIAGLRAGAQTRGRAPDVGSLAVGHERE
jgi:AcrR family transcriptional regulator